MDLMLKTLRKIKVSEEVNYFLNRIVHNGFLTRFALHKPNEIKVHPCIVIYFFNFRVKITSGRVPKNTPKHAGRFLKNA